MKGFTQIEDLSTQVQISKTLCISLDHVNKLFVIINKFLFQLYVVRVEFITLQSTSSLIPANTQKKGT